MDTALAQLHDRFFALEQENEMLRSHLQSCEQSYVLLQAQVAEYRQREQDSQELAGQGQIAELATVNHFCLEHRLLEATATVANTLLSIGDFNTAVNTALQILGEALETDRLIVAENFAPESGCSFPYWRLLYEWDSPGTVSQIAHPDLAQGSWEGIEQWYEQLSQGQSINQLLEDMPEPFHRVLAKLGTKAIHSVPIFVEGKYWGQLGFDDCHEAKSRSSAEFSALKIAANCIGSAIQQNRTQQALLQAEQKRVAQLERLNAELQQTLSRLAESEKRYRTLFELSNEGIYRFEFDPPVSTSMPIDEQIDLVYQNYRYAEVNHTFVSMLGLQSAADAIGKSFANFFKNLETNREGVYAAAANGYQIRNVEAQQIDANGQQRYVLWNTVCDLRDGYVCGGWGMQTDITELRETQQALLEAEQARSRSAAERSAQLEKANEALRRCLDCLAGEPDLDSILHHILTEIVVQLDAKGLAVFYYDVAAHTLNLANTLKADHSPAPDVDSEEVVLFKVPVPADITPYWQTLLQFRAPMILDANNPAHIHLFWPDTREWHLRWNQPIAVGVPMLVGDEALGFLGLTFEGNVTLTPEQLSLAQALTHQATLAIKLMRLAEEARQAAIAREQEKAAQQQAAELSRANTLLRNSLSRLSTGPNLKDVLGHLLVELVRYAGASVGHILIHDATQNTLTLSVRCQDGQAFWTPADDEPVLFRSPIPLEHTPIFTHLCAQPRLAILNPDEFEGQLWEGVSQWFQAKGYRGICSCVLMVGDRPFGMLAMAFPQPVAFRSVEEELILALTQQIALVIQLTTLGEADKQAAVAREQEKAAQERAAELAKANNALKHSLDRLAQESNLDSFLGHILSEFANQVQATAGHIFLFNVETNTLKLCLEIQNGQLYHQARPNEPQLFGSDIPADITPIFQYLCQKRTLSFWSAGEFNGMAWPGIPEWFEREGFTEAVCLALIVGEQPVGLLALEFRGKSTLKPEEAELIHALAHQATLAIQLTRLAEEAKQAAIFEERNRMASEIHDTLAQAFTGISLQLEVAKSLVHQDPQTVQQILDHLSRLAETGLAEARRSVWALYPPAAEYADLAQMLYESVEQMARNTSTSVEVNLQGTPCALPPLIGMNLLRIGQEAITNALKHSQAQTITIELSYEPDRIFLTIGDNGCGFTPPTTIDSLNGGFGLMGMYERCDRIGAQLSLTSQLGQGTQILVEAPLS